MVNCFPHAKYKYVLFCPPLIPVESWSSCLRICKVQACMQRLADQTTRAWEKRKVRITRAGPCNNNPYVAYTPLPACLNQPTMLLIPRDDDPIDRLQVEEVNWQIEQHGTCFTAMSISLQPLNPPRYEKVAVSSATGIQTSDEDIMTST